MLKLFVSPLKTWKATLQGYGAVLIWSWTALFIHSTQNLSLFFILAISAFVGFLFYIPGWIKSPERLRTTLQQPLKNWNLLFLALFVYRFFYISGLRTAPIIEANLINYLWPPIMLVIGNLYKHRRPSERLMVALAAGIIGLLFIGLIKNGSYLTFEFGHYLSLIAAVLWAIFLLQAKDTILGNNDIIGVIHLLSFAFFMTLHCLYEPKMDFGQILGVQWISLLGLGMAVSLSYKLWDNALSLGHFTKMVAAVSMIPFLSTFWLILCKGEILSPYLGLAAILILCSSFLVRFLTLSL